MDKKEVIEKLTIYKKIVSKYFDIDKVVLFGSYAKGNQNEDSDIDVAVIVNSLGQDFFAYAPLLWKLRRDIDDRIEPILIEKNSDESGFLKDILKTGLEI
ncbi:MAG: nucleotidyltransferase domain-containing protein [Bacteroidetes bacterium CG02_land_8_20_14_3_00_31_25]|nr:nucleotidyltransferase domain-containing protein [Bacteroidota bacterium]PIV57754.1 MAG: nucleotidyltransferase domain-containing protein [Bacteroidetes bacterium CG02_land_8_20_14_3_00_31_25]PIY06242.1 MAG: nucleotidyltransferase domain-containing protein [Bacteroidetes bacterium CG_4_10_14_3_um_filter_31_20]